MAKNDFFLQGIVADTFIDAVRWVLKVPKLKKIIIGTAFVNEEGVRNLEKDLTPLANKVSVFAGIRNDITSKQGLARLLKIKTSVFVVDTGSRGIIFHPKLYLAKGENNTRLVIGSGNFTPGGLNNNIEGGLMLDLDMNERSDKKLVSNIEAQFKQLLDRFPENVSLIQKSSELDLLLKTGRLLDEAEAQPPRPISTGRTTKTDTVPRIKLVIPFLPRTIRRAKSKPAILRPKPSKNLPSYLVSTNLEHVWDSKPLTERDLNVPSSRNTHAAGSISLDKGRLDEHVDHRHYFRKEIFAGLKWAKKSRSVEEAKAEFQLMIKGISYGDFQLRIAHSFSTTSASYKQHNAMTRLSWGLAKEYVAQRNLIGRTLSLYRDESNLVRFVLEID